jgi:hypothetical protein
LDTGHWQKWTGIEGNSHTVVPKFRPNKRQAALGKKAESIAKIGKMMNA